MRNLFLSTLLLIVSFASYATDNLAEIHCSVELQSEGINGVTSETKDLVKTVKIRKSLFNANKKIVKLNETVKFNHNYSVVVEMKESLDLIRGTSVLDIQGTLLRHRVGNGKIVLGENFQTIDSESFNFSNHFNLTVLNDYINFENKSSVVKGAFIECSTL